MPAQNVIDQEIDWQYEQSSDLTLEIWIHYVQRKENPKLEDLPFGFESQTFVRILVNFTLLIIFFSEKQQLLKN